MCRLKNSPLVILLFVGVIAFSSCEDEDKQGCTDHTSLNYDPTAEVDDGSCEYLDSTVAIWSNGVVGYWGESQPIGQIDLFNCNGTGDSLTLDPDSAWNGVMAYYMAKNNNGQFALSARLQNRQDGRPFGNGFLQFQAMLGPNSDLSDFDVTINGNSCGNLGSCLDICRSGPVVVSTSNMTDSTWSLITIPLLDFQSRTLNLMNNLVTIKGDVATGGDTVMYVREMYWKTVLD